MRPLFIAHRGGSLERPKNSLENSMPAFSKAAAAGFALECDVQLSCDGIPFIFHDRTTAHIEKKARETASLTSTEMQHLHMPTLDAFVASFLGKVPLMIELKRPMNGSISPLIDAVLSVLVNPHPSCFIGSLSSNCMKELVERSLPHKLIGIAECETCLEENLALGIDQLAVNKDILTSKVVTEIKKKAHTLWVWTVNDPAQAQELVSWGVDGIITDCPNKTSAFFFERGLL